MFLEKDLSYKLVGCFYEVRNKYGRWHRENFYDKVLDEVMEIKGLKFVDKPNIPLYSLDTGKKITIFIPDKLVENKIIIELKAKPYIFEDDARQVLEYLKASKYEIIYLVNFGEITFKPQRLIYTNDRKPFICENL